MKIYRIAFVEDGEVNYTAPITDLEVLSGIYRTFDEYAIASGEDIWVEFIEGEWRKKTDGDD